jgi:uncharacterized protein
MLSAEFEWDPDKSDANLRERGFDLAFAARAFEGVTLEVRDRRRNYGEVRYVAIGWVHGIVLTVAYTDRDGDGNRPVRRIISARRSNRREREAYEEAVRQRARLADGDGPSRDSP